VLTETPPAGDDDAGADAPLPVAALLAVELLLLPPQAAMPRAATTATALAMRFLRIKVASQSRFSRLRTPDPVAAPILPAGAG
jgi:hypothetical protein